MNELKTPFTRKWEGCVGDIQRKPKTQSKLKRDIYSGSGSPHLRVVGIVLFFGWEWWKAAKEMVQEVRKQAWNQASACPPRILSFEIIQSDPTAHHPTIPPSLPRRDQESWSTFVHVEGKWVNLRAWSEQPKVSLLPPSKQAQNSWLQSGDDAKCFVSTEMAQLEASKHSPRASHGAWILKLTQLLLPSLDHNWPRTSPHFTGLSYFEGFTSFMRVIL